MLRHSAGKRNAYTLLDSYGPESFWTFATRVIGTT